jgi:hypothetical protein
VSRILCGLALVALAACSGASGERASEEFHQSIAANSRATVHVDNVAGSVNVDSWSKPSVDVRATKFGRTPAELRSVMIDVRRDGNDVYVKTSFEGLNHGGVRYRITVPANASVQISNIAGGVAVAGVSGDVTVATQAGAITANAGRVGEDRSIDLHATTGEVHLTVAPDSSARVDASSTVGAITSRIPGVAASRENLVGARASGLIGAGSGRIRVSTTTGAITLRF